MKRCPQCGRDYYDDSLLYCLDDGMRVDPKFDPLRSEERFQGLLRRIGLRDENL